MDIKRWEDVANDANEIYTEGWSEEIRNRDYRRCEACSKEKNKATSGESVFTYIDCNRDCNIHVDLYSS